LSSDSGNALPLALAGEGWGGGGAARRAGRGDRLSPTRRALARKCAAERVDLRASFARLDPASGRGKASLLIIRLNPNVACLLLPPLQHDFAAGLAGFQQSVGALEIGGVDRSEGLIERGAQNALVDQVGDIVEQHVLADHVRRLER
jgi:hypothetical protein